MGRGLRAVAPVAFGSRQRADKERGFYTSIFAGLPSLHNLISGYALGRHLLRRPDINAVRFNDLVANAALPATQRRDVNALRPYKGFSVINMYLSDSNSNYNSLQVYATKRKGNSTFSVSYTWSKALGDTVGGGNGDGVPTGEDPFNRRVNYGPLSFDRRHILVTSYTYRIPTLKDSNAFTKSVWTDGC